MVNNEHPSHMAEQSFSFVLQVHQKQNSSYMARRKPPHTWPQPNTNKRLKPKNLSSYMAIGEANLLTPKAFFF